MSIGNNLAIIVPTCNRYNVLEENIKNILAQKVVIKEVLICDDSDKEYKKDNINNLEFIKKYSVVKYYYCARFDENGKKDYGLARARNFGIVNATADILVFLDDRLTPDGENSIAKLAKPLVNNTKKVWTFGNKGADKKSFVENFSAIRRSNIIVSGCFFERIDKYGGMTREVIARFTNQGYKFEYVSDAMAKQLAKSTNWEKKEKEIPEMRKLLENLKLC